MARDAELAIKEVNEAGGILGGQTVTSTRADSTCIDASAAAAAADRLVNADKVDAIVVACAQARPSQSQNVSVPTGTLQVHPQRLLRH